MASVALERSDAVVAEQSDPRETHLLAEMDAIGILDVPKKPTVIRLRWLVVIVSSYLLISSQESWLALNFLHGFVVFYILTNLGLYLVEERLFESKYFYSPVVVFDTLFVTVALVISGQVATDFYLAYFLIIIVSTIWQDFRGAVVIAGLATMLYGYLLFQTTPVYDPSVYLRIPFLFVIALFYGYFVQVVRFEKAMKEQVRQEAQDIAMLQSLSQTLPASLDYKQIIGTVREKIINVVRPAKLYILVIDEKKDFRRAFAFEGGEGADPLPRQVDLEKYPIVQECIQTRRPVMQRNVTSNLLTSQARAEPEGFSYTTSSAIPILFRTELHGVLLLGFNEADRLLNSREIQFCQIVAFAMAIALSNAKKYEQLQIEAQRRQKIADQLAEANRLKSEFMANTTHELRTPIAAVLGYADLLGQEVFGPLTEQQKSTLDRLAQNARGMLTLVEDILDFSRLERGEDSLQVQQREMVSLIDELRLDLAPLEKEKPFQVKYEIADGIPTIKTDWAKLKRILSSLLGNALKFTREGEVKLSICSAGDGTVSFVVSDTGIGIPDENIPLIFEKFRQLDGSSTRRYGGTGLGLTITKNLVDLLGGTIGVESAVGEGSVFRVTIPIRGHDIPMDAVTNGNP